MIASRARARLPSLSAAIGAVLASLLLPGCFAAPPQIVALVPPDGSTHLNADTPVEVFFDQAVRHQSVAASFGICAVQGGGCGKNGLSPGCTDLAAAFQAAPGSNCWVHWLSGQSGFVFYHPGALFAANTKYQFSLRAGVQSVAGTVNSLDHYWNLTSAPAPTLTASTPGNGETGFPPDGVISLSFSHAMNTQSLAAAVSLSPPVPGTRVVANPTDPAAFEVVPRQPLAANTAYTLTVSRKAGDIHGQPLGTKIRIRFRTGTLPPGSQAVVLAGQEGAGATEVLVAPLSTAPSSLPIPAEIVAQAGLCQAAAGCGGLSQGQPTVTFDHAAISPGSGWMALQETDLSTPRALPQLHIVDMATGREQIAFQDSEWPSWSPDGSTLAFVSAGSTVELYQPRTGSLTSLKSGLPPSSTPVWTGSGDTLAIPVASGDGSVERVDLATPALDARYPLPGLSGRAIRIVAAPSGQELALAVQTPQGVSTWLARPASSQEPQQLAAASLPVGFVDSATLIAVEPSAGGAPQLVRIDLGSGATAPLATPPLHPELDTAAVAPDGRQIAYLATTGSGRTEALVANADGTGVRPILLPQDGLVPLSVNLGT